jgi:hypothetical protein
MAYYLPSQDLCSEARHRILTERAHEAVSLLHDHESYTEAPILFHFEHVYIIMASPYHGKPIKKADIWKPRLNHEVAAFYTFAE